MCIDLWKSNSLCASNSTNSTGTPAEYIIDSLREHVKNTFIHSESGLVYCLESVLSREDQCTVGREYCLERTSVLLGECTVQRGLVYCWESVLSREDQCTVGRVYCLERADVLLGECTVQRGLLYCWDSVLSREDQCSVGKVYKLSREDCCTVGRVYCLERTSVLLGECTVQRGLVYCLESVLSREDWCTVGRVFCLVQMMALETLARTLHQHQRELSVNYVHSNNIILFNSGDKGKKTIKDARSCKNAHHFLRLFCIANFIKLYQDPVHL